MIEKNGLETGKVVYEDDQLRVIVAIGASFMGGDELSSSLFVENKIDRRASVLIEPYDKMLQISSNDGTLVPSKNAFGHHAIKVMGGKPQ